MAGLVLRFARQRIEVGEGESVGFGRTCTDPGLPKGWGYQGRFIELGAESHIHRIWGEIAQRNGLWFVRALGTRHPVTVDVPGRGSVELPACVPGEPPAEFAVANDHFSVVLSVGTSEYRLECSSAPPPAPPPPLVEQGSATSTLGDELAASITELEFGVLWAMSREYREPVPGRSPAPLTYARIIRMLGLHSERQAVAAVERLTRKFRCVGLLPAGLDPARQREWICRQAVAHGIVDLLVARFGAPGRA